MIEGDVISLEAILVIGSVLFVALLALALFALLRRSDPSRAIASATVAPGAPIALRFAAPGSGPHRVWMRYEVAYDGGDDDYGIAAEIQIQTAHGLSVTAEQRAGDRAPVLGPYPVSSGGLHRVREWSTPAGQGVRASIEVARVPGLAPGTEVSVTGRVAVSEGCRLVGLLVFVMPG